jgi:hypothetical protein
MNETNFTTNNTLHNLNTLLVATNTFAASTSDKFGNLSQLITASKYDENCFTVPKIDHSSGISYITD